MKHCPGNHGHATRCRRRRYLTGCDIQQAFHLGLQFPHLLFVRNEALIGLIEQRHQILVVGFERPRARQRHVQRQRMRSDGDRDAFQRHHQPRFTETAAQRDLEEGLACREGLGGNVEQQRFVLEQQR